VINVRLKGAEATRIKYRGSAEAIQKGLRATMEYWAIEVQRHTKEDKLSGQVLRNGTGNLRSSINYRVQESGSSLVAAVGTNIVYAAIHEYGFDGDESVRAHIRRSKAQMQAAMYHYRNKNGEVVTKYKQTGKFGRSTGEIQVHAFTRHMVMPERSYLRTALADLMPQIKSGMSESVKAALP